MDIISYPAIVIHRRARVHDGMRADDRIGLNHGTRENHSSHTNLD